MSETVEKTNRPIHILFVNEICLMGNGIPTAIEDEPDICVAGYDTHLEIEAEAGMVMYDRRRFI